MIDINKLQEITEKLNRSKLLKGMAYDVLNTFIEQQKKQLTLTDVVVPKGTLCGYVNCEKPTVDIDKKWCEYHDRQINM